jgi:hypothetical protein
MECPLRARITSFGRMSVGEPTDAARIETT